MNLGGVYWFYLPLKAILKPHSFYQKNDRESGNKNIMLVLSVISTNF